MSGPSAQAGGGGRTRDPWAWPASLLLGSIFAAAAMAVSFAWFGVVDGKRGWLVPPDIWMAVDSARTISAGALPWVYQTPWDTYALPLGYAILAPAVALGDHLGLVEGSPVPLPYPSMWLVVGPWSLLLGVLLLRGVRAMAVGAGVRRPVAVQCVAVLLVLVPCGAWSHPEDVLALAFACGSWRSVATGRHLRGALMIACAISCKQWAVVVLPFLLLLVPMGARLRFVARAVSLPVLLAGWCLALDWSDASWHLLSPVLVPMWMDPGHHAVFARLLGAHTSALSRLLELGAAPLAAWRCRRCDQPTQLAVLGVVLLCRPVLEPYSYAYYWAPGLLLCSLAIVTAKGRIGLRAGAALAACMAWSLPGDGWGGGYWVGQLLLAATALACVRRSLQSSPERGISSQGDVQDVDARGASDRLVNTPDGAEQRPGVLELAATHRR